MRRRRAMETDRATCTTIHAPRWGMPTWKQDALTHALIGSSVLPITMQALGHPSDSTSHAHRNAGGRQLPAQCTLPSSYACRESDVPLLRVPLSLMETTGAGW